MNNEANDPRAWDSTKPRIERPKLSRDLQSIKGKSRMQRRRALLMKTPYEDKVDLLPTSIVEGKYAEVKPSYKTKHAEIMENFTKNAKKAKKNAPSPTRPVLKKAWKAARARSKSRSRSRSSSSGSPGEKAARAKARTAQQRREQGENEGMIGSDQGSGNEDDALPAFNQAQYEPQYADLALFEQDTEGKPKRTTRIAPLPINMTRTERSKDWTMNAQPAPGDYNAAMKKKLNKLLKSKKKITRRIPGMKKGSVWDDDKERWINPNIKETYKSRSSSSSKTPKSSSSSSKTPKTPKCPVGYIWNKDTERCVIRTGKVGMEILKARSASSSSSASSGTKATRKKNTAVRKKISGAMRAVRAVFRPKTKYNRARKAEKKGPARAKVSWLTKTGRKPEPPNTYTYVQPKIVLSGRNTEARYLQRKYKQTKNDTKGKQLSEEDIQLKMDRAQRKTIPELKAAIKAANENVSVVGSKSELVVRLVNLRITKQEAMTRKRKKLETMRELPQSFLLPGGKRKTVKGQVTLRKSVVGKYRDVKNVKEWAQSKSIDELKTAIQAANKNASLEGSRSVLMDRVVNLYETMEATSLPAGYYPLGHIWKKPDAKTGRTPGVSWKNGQGGKLEMVYTPKPYQNELMESWRMTTKDVIDPWRHDTNVLAWNTAVKKEIRKLEFLSHALNHSDFLTKAHDKAESLKRVNTKMQIILIEKLKKTEPRAGQLIRERLSAPRSIRTVVAETPQKALELQKRNEQLDRIMSIIGHGAAREVPRNVPFVQTVHSTETTLYRRPQQAGEKVFSGGEYTKSSRRVVKFDPKDSEAAYHRYITPAPHYERGVAVYQPSTRKYLTRRDVKVLNIIDINDVNINHWDNNNKSVGKITLKDIVRTERSTYQAGMVNIHKDDGFFSCEDGVREFAYDARLDLTGVLSDDIDSKVPISLDDVIKSQLWFRGIYAEEAEKYKRKIRLIQRMDFTETERNQMIGALLRKKLEKTPIRRNEDIIVELETYLQAAQQHSRTDKLNHGDLLLLWTLYEMAQFRIAKYEVPLTESQRQRMNAVYMVFKGDTQGPRSVAPYKVTNIGNKSFTPKGSKSGSKSSSKSSSGSQSKPRIII